MTNCAICDEKIVCTINRISDYQFPMNNFGSLQDKCAPGRTAPPTKMSGLDSLQTIHAIL